MFSPEEFLLSFPSERPHPCLQLLLLTTSLTHTLPPDTHTPTDTRHLSGVPLDVVSSLFLQCDKMAPGHIDVEI